MYDDVVAIELFKQKTNYASTNEQHDHLYKGAQATLIECSSFVGAESDRKMG